MPQLRIALAQANPCVGDLAGNAALVLERTCRAVDEGAHLIVFPEMVLTGYPVEDLALRESFVAASRREVEVLAERLSGAGCGDIAAFVGYLDADEVGVRNAVAVLHGGTVVARQFKHHLPNYGVFDERRHFAQGETLQIVRVHGLDVGIAICEDLWQDGGPVAALGELGVDLIVSPNASPYEYRKNDTRLPLVSRWAREADAPLAYTNQVGGQDDLVFDGDSLVADSRGTVLARAPQFIEHLLVTDLELPGKGRRYPAEVAGFATRHVVLADEAVLPYDPSRAGALPEPLSDTAEVWAALVTGLRDYATKNGFHSVILGLSGGIDSAVSAAVAVDALGADAVHGVSMPSVYSSDHASSDAAELARRTGLHYRVHPVAAMVASFVEGLGLTGVAEENIQARCRGMLLMALSNAEGHLVLATGNKTELAVGYSTIYGDAVGGFAPIKDVLKTNVWHLARWRNADAERRGATPPIPENSISKEPSAELRPDQRDSDSLPDYELLDAILDGYVEGDKGYQDLLDEGFDHRVVDRVVRMVDGAEYKRRQYPPGTKITFKAFGRDRRLPITNAWREHG